LEKWQTAFLNVFNLLAWVESSASVDAIMQLLPVIPNFLRRQPHHMPQKSADRLALKTDKMAKEQTICHPTPLLFCCAFKEIHKQTKKRQTTK